MQNAVKAEVFLQSLALAVARNNVGAAIPIHQVMKSEGLTLAEYHDIELNPTFQRHLAKYEQELTDSGFSFEAKCKLLAEDMLPGFYNLGRDMDTPAPVRAKIMESLVKWGKLEPKTDVMAGGSAGFSININLTQPEMATISLVPTNSDDSEEGLDLEGEFSAESDENDDSSGVLSISDTLAELEALDPNEEFTETPESQPEEDFIPQPTTFGDVVPLRRPDSTQRELMQLSAWANDFLEGGDEASVELEFTDNDYDDEED